MIPEGWLATDIMRRTNASQDILHIIVMTTSSVADLGFFLQRVTNPMRTEGRILCICELGRGHN